MKVSGERRELKMQVAHPAQDIPAHKRSNTIAFLQPRDIVVGRRRESAAQFRNHVGDAPDQERALDLGLKGLKALVTGGT